MTGLKLTRRDDPLAPGPPTGGDSTVAPAPTPPARENLEGTRREDAAPASRAAVQSDAEAEVGSGGGPYDADRLEQTGWRLYESVVAKVREDAMELSEAGTPASAASYAAAVLALRAPETVEEKLELMRRWHQLTASRTRARRGGSRVA